MTRWSICPSVSSVFELLAPALEQRASTLRHLHPLAELERVEVGDDDLGAFNVAQACRPVPVRGSRNSCPDRWAGARADDL